MAFISGIPRIVSVLSVIAGLGLGVISLVDSLSGPEGYLFCFYWFILHFVAGWGSVRFIFRLQRWIVLRFRNDPKK